MLATGGTFALYSLLCRYAKLSLLPYQQTADESMYYGMGIAHHSISSPLKRYFEKHKKLQTSFLLIVLFAVCMVLGDGILTTSLSSYFLSRNLKFHSFAFYLLVDSFPAVQILN
jgi:KUP system potassium uptake protein